MDAPLYRPAQAYEEPRLKQTEFGIDAITVLDLLRSDATRAILTQEIPGFDKLARVPQLQGQLTNITLTTLAGFSTFAGIVSKAALDRIDARLRTLPQQAWPGL